MAYTINITKAAEYFTFANAGTGPTAAQNLALQAIVNDYASSSITDEVAFNKIVNLASDSTTAVSVGAYEFFLGFAPSQAGLTSLNAAYVGSGAQASLNGENRFIAQSVSLALQNATAKASFSASYGSLSVEAATKAAYLIIIGQAAADANNVNVDSAVSFLASASAQADLDLAVKAAIVGEILFQATSYNNGTGIGSYATATTNLIKDLADDGVLVANNVNGIDLFTAYGASASAAKTLALTTGADSLTGGSANDVFNASYTSSNMTFDASDSLDGAAGNDTLNVSVGAAGTWQAASLKNIENVVANFSAAGTLSLLGATGVTSVTVQGPTAAATVSGIGSTATALKYTNTAQNVTFAFAGTAVAGSSDAATVTVSGVTGGTLTVDGIETLTLNSADTASTITTLTAAAADTLVITGNQTLTITDNLSADITTIDASAATGKVDLDFDAGDATVTGGAGNDVFSFETNTGTASVDGGAGNDSITFFATGFTNADVVKGGEGTDTLIVASADAVAYTTPTTTKVSGFETLRLSTALSGDLTVATIQSGISTLTLAAGAGAARTVTMEAGTQTINSAAASTGNFSVVDTGTATTDVLNLNDTSTGGNAFGGGATYNLSVTGYETVNLSTGSSATATEALGTVTLAADTGGTTTLIVTGANSLTTTGAITAGVINASGLTGDAVLTMGAAAASGLTKITGSANGDTLLGDAASTIDGGAGNDTITGGTGNDNLLGGDGNDSITGNTGNDVINGGAGNDTIVLGANLATGDVVDGGDGTDTLSITNASLTTLNGYSISAATALNNAISNVERLIISDTLDQTTFDTARIDGINYITLAGGWTGAETLSGLAAASTIVLNDGESTNTVANALTLALADSSGSADSVTVRLVNDNSTDFEGIVVTGYENLTINTAEATATVTAETHTLRVTGAGLTTLTITGTESLDISSSAVAATTIDASGLADATAGTAPNFKVLGNSANQNIIGSGGADTIDGGAGVDTIDGGAGADSITGGTGADVLTGGNGADTIIGGSGNDTIILTETVAAVDKVNLTYSQAGTYVDTITGFTTGSSGDGFQLSLSALEAASNLGGINASATNFQQLNADTDASAGAAGVQVLTGAATAGANTVFVLSGASFSATGDVEDALETGGSFALTISATNADLAVGDSFVVVYTDGTNTHIAAATITTDPGTGGVFAAGNLTIVDLAVVNGVGTIGSSTFSGSNFSWIA
jgi:Ca2+-binding RTX toxin-like protein